MFKFNGTDAVTLARAFGGAPNQVRKSEVPCPDCESFMVYTEPNIIHQDPPRKRIKCPTCGLKSWHEVEFSDKVIDITDSILTMNSSASDTPEQSSETSEPPPPQDRD